MNTNKIVIENHLCMVEELFSILNKANYFLEDKIDEKVICDFYLPKSANGDWMLNSISILLNQKSEDCFYYETESGYFCFFSYEIFLPELLIEKKKNIFILFGERMLLSNQTPCGAV